MTLQELKNRIDTIRAKKDQAIGSQNRIMEEIKKFDCSTIKEVEQKIIDLEKEINDLTNRRDELESSLSKAVSELESKING